MSILKWTDFTTALDELDIWPILARPNQLPPPGEDWFAWLLLAGRGFGKTRALVEFVREKVAAGAAMRVALVAPTAADARNILVEGASGILACSPPWFRPSFEPSKRRLTWPSGTIATLYSADEPERLRGPQHDLAAVDELGSWRYQAAWDNLMLGLRLGDRPLCAVATTPRPTKLIKDLVNREGAGVVVTRGTSYENRSNLAPQFFDLITKKYEGTRLGRQELMGELLVDVPGALWKLDQLERLRRSQAPELQRIVVAIDPSGSGSEEADECGIVAAGVDDDGRAWVLADASGKYQPTEWAKRAIKLYYELGADRIVAETNFGGQNCRSNDASRRSEYRLPCGHGQPRKSGPCGTGCRALRTGARAPCRHLSRARGSDVRFYRTVRQSQSRVFSWTCRRARLGIDRSGFAADERLGVL